MNNEKELSPLAERCRPKSIEEFIGQNHLMSDGKILKAVFVKKSPFSMILWGEPGSGKTTLAFLIAKYCDMDSYFVSAISAGVRDVRKIIDKGKENKIKGIPTLLVIDEIHRFNKSQQDAVLGAVESGDVVLIGATTENPSFQVISPLLSRTRVLRLKKLSDHDLSAILDNAIKKDYLLKDKKIIFDDGIKDNLIGLDDFVFFSFQLRPGYVICSFVFLLLGLAALSSSINLLVLRFMILSLEEEEQVNLN